MPAVVEARIAGLRREHPGWGPSRLRWELERAGVVPLPGRSAGVDLAVPVRQLSSDAHPVHEFVCPAVIFMTFTGTCFTDPAWKAP